MGKIVLELPGDWSMDRRTASTIHVVGLDGFPWPCKIAKAESTITITRNRDESGHLFLSYPFEKFGELVISTGTLPESEAPYRLLLELARGTLNRLRNLVSNWQEGGLPPSQSVANDLTASVIALRKSALAEDPKTSDEFARQSLEFSMQSIFDASEQFGQHVYPMRSQHINVPKHWLGCKVTAKDIEVEKDSLSFLDIIQVSELNENVREQKNIILGPFLDASPGGMPVPWQELSDFEERQVSVVRTCRDALHDLPENIKLLHVARGLNGTGHRFLSYPQQLQLTLDLLEVIENSKHRVPTLVSFDCPWGERMAWSVGGVHPLQIADSILRRGVALSMLGLDISLDYLPNGSLPRDPIQWLDLIDVWSQLGLPLVICLCAPSQNNTLVASASPDRIINSIRESQTDEQMEKLLSIVIPMMLARPNVHGIVWTQSRDGDDVRYSNGGLLDQAGQVKPIARVFANVKTC